MTDSKGELVPSSHRELARLPKNPFEMLLEERFKTFTKELTDKNAPFVYVPRVDERQERFPMDLDLTQVGCTFWDIIPNAEDNVLSKYELHRKSYGDLQRKEGDSLDFPINTLGRIALRRIKNKAGDEVWAYTIEAGGKIDTKKAAVYSDYVAQGVTRGIPSYIQINTAGRSMEDLTTRLDLALHQIEPNLFNPNYNPAEENVPQNPLHALPAPHRLDIPMNTQPKSASDQELSSPDDVDDWLISYLNGAEEDEPTDKE
ncbi:MAG: hypothetical protein KA035_03290 [Candidatus Levybacteria bacterium]|nr:hypothetical protein [Candidatus Levybacteria bacterium]